jgi:hypothetical protein
LLCCNTQLVANSSTHGGEYQAVYYAAVWYMGTTTSEDPTASVFQVMRKLIEMVLCVLAEIKHPSTTHKTVIICTNTIFS